MAARQALFNSEIAMRNLFKMVSINLFRTPKVSVTKYGEQSSDDQFNTKAGDEVEET